MNRILFVKKYFKTYTSFLVPPLSRNFKIKYVSVHMNEIFLNSDFSEMGKNERDRGSFPFSSVQFMNLAHIFADF